MQSISIFKIAVCVLVKNSSTLRLIYTSYQALVSDLRQLGFSFALASMHFFAMHPKTTLMSENSDINSSSYFPRLILGF